MLNARQHQKQSGTVLNCMSAGRGQYPVLHDSGNGKTSSESGFTGMARRRAAAELHGRPCATAQLQPQAPLTKSNPPGPALKPSAFVNGFQKRLVVYSNSKTGCHTGVASEESETDISSLEIDSNLSDSSIPSNPASPKPSFPVPRNDDNLLHGSLAHSVNNSISKFELSDRRDQNITDNNNSSKQPNFSLKSTSQNGDIMTSSLKHGTPSPSSRQQRRSPITTTTQKFPDTQPLVLKIRRRTWAPGETASPRDAKRARPDLGRASLKSLSESLDCGQQAVKGEWQSVMETREPKSEKDEAEVTEQTRITSSFLGETNLDRPKIKHCRHHRHRKSTKSKAIHRDCVQHRNGSHLKTMENSHPRSHRACKTHRRKLKKNASKKNQHHSSNQTGKMLRLPSDPQKAVRVLEKALESINAQIKQLKKETELDEKRTNKPKSRRDRKKTVTKKKRKKKKRLKGDTNKRHSKGFSAPVLNPSEFKLNDFFSVVPSLVVRDNDLHPAYRASVDPGEPPSASHPIWRWRLGQPPLPRT
ncbi:probable serine/threonine-protein kinase mkcB [Patiria miniata]|uniref:Uncharacterized protein n=1 Tax=Patiria miniata TaxID=46514 RepID=A0A914BM79_PATMI|nr:probable serine/threonine-protein kinase mkcB [Patiria miniata]